MQNEEKKNENLCKAFWYGDGAALIVILRRVMDDLRKAQSCGTTLQLHLHVQIHVQSLRLGKAKRLRLKTTPIFSREKEELPQVGLEPTTFHVHVHCMHVYALVYHIERDSKSLLVPNL